MQVLYWRTMVILQLVDDEDANLISETGFQFQESRIKPPLKDSQQSQSLIRIRIRTSRIGIRHRHCLLYSWVLGLDTTVVFSLLYQLHVLSFHSRKCFKIVVSYPWLHFQEKILHCAYTYEYQGQYWKSEYVFRFWASISYPVSFPLQAQSTTTICRCELESPVPADFQYRYSVPSN